MPGASALWVQLCAAKRSGAEGRGGLRGQQDGWAGRGGRSAWRARAWMLKESRTKRGGAEESVAGCTRETSGWQPGL